ncbi:MAG: NADH-quinone oxidoreductase subunit B family protein [Thermomicrobiales bacterium]
MSDTPEQASKTVPLLLPMAKSQPRADRELAETLSSRIRQVLRRSLHVRHLDAGSCNACDWEIQALLGPTYDIQRLGIDIVASPRHADLLLVTGSVTANLREAALRTYEAMPRPGLVVAVGACACGGGVLQGSYCTAGGVANVLPVDLYIPGCPPRPQALIHGLLVAVDRLEPRLKHMEIAATIP